MWSEVKFAAMLFFFIVGRRLDVRAKNSCVLCYRDALLGYHGDRDAFILVEPIIRVDHLR